MTLPDGDELNLVREIDGGDAGVPIPTLVLRANLDPSVAARAMDAGAPGGALQGGVGGRDRRGDK